MKQEPTLVTEGDRQLAEGISLYIHIPFCQTKCPYCDFNTYQGIEPLIDPYMEALLLEIQLWGRTLGHPTVNTIFFGGGTPSYIPTRDVGKVLDTTGGAFSLAQDAETTVEANPGDLSGPALDKLLEIGVNRLSIGVQSLDDDLLSLLGRRHSAGEAVEVYKLATHAGFQRINIDLMYGLPHQTMAQWKSTLERVLELTPPHLSMYCLTLEKGTPMERRVSEGELPEPDPDLAADMYELARGNIREGRLPPLRDIQLGHARQRVSPQHGLLAQPAVSGSRRRRPLPPLRAPVLDGEFTRPIRSGCSQLVFQYSAPEQGLDEPYLSSTGVAGGVETIGPSLEMAETMFLGLRLLDGLKVKDFKSRFNRDPLEVYGPQIRELGELGLMEHSDGVLRLTKKGYLLSNQVFIQFLGVIDPPNCLLFPLGAILRPSHL